MKFEHALLLGGIFGPNAAEAQDAFEPADFNVTQALVDNGVILSDIAQSAALAPAKDCSGAVRHEHF